jgi:hypothetical protein
MFKKNWTLLGLSLALTSQLFTQTIGETISNGELHGNFQIDAQYYNEDSILLYNLWIKHLYFTVLFLF